MTLASDSRANPIPAKFHFRSTDLRSATRLAVDATLGVVGIVEHLHHNIARVSPPLGKASDRPTSGITGLVYRSIRGVTRLSGGALDLALRPLETILGRREQDGGPASNEREAFIAALNGVVGDHLAATGNAFAIPMTLRHEGRALLLGPEPSALHVPGARRRILLLVHGLCMHPAQWGGDAAEPGLAWAQARESTLLYLHYNTGRPIGANGRGLAQVLESLFTAWPVELDEIAIVSHSMGGLVARSAVHYGLAEGHRWPALLKKIVFLGTPHHGSPLERAGRVVDVALGASPYSAAFARIGGVRSAGITDLRHGRVLDEQGAGAEPQHVPLPSAVACYAVAGTLAVDVESRKRRLLGDGLVSVDSALGRHREAGRSLGFGEGRQRLFDGVGHLGLLDDPAVVEQVKAWLSAPECLRPPLLA